MSSRCPRYYIGAQKLPRSPAFEASLEISANATWDSIPNNLITMSFFFHNNSETCQECILHPLIWPSSPRQGFSLQAFLCILLALRQPLLSSLHLRHSTGAQGPFSFSQIAQLQPSFSAGQNFTNGLRMIEGNYNIKMENSDHIPDIPTPGMWAKLLHRNQIFGCFLLRSQAATLVKGQAIPSPLTLYSHTLGQVSFNLS